MQEFPWCQTRIRPPSFVEINRVCVCRLIRQIKSSGVENGRFRSFQCACSQSRQVTSSLALQVARHWKCRLASFSFALKCQLWICFYSSQPLRNVWWTYLTFLEHYNEWTSLSSHLIWSVFHLNPSPGAENNNPGWIMLCLSLNPTFGSGGTN